MNDIWFKFTIWARPLQGRIAFAPRSMGFTHGYSCCSPPAKLEPRPMHESFRSSDRRRCHRRGHRNSTLCHKTEFEQRRRLISAKRNNVNSHGCQPMEQNLQNCFDPERVRQNSVPGVRPLQGRIELTPCSIGFTHGYSCCSPPANIGPLFVLLLSRGSHI